MIFITSPIIPQFFYINISKIYFKDTKDENKQNNL